MWHNRIALTICRSCPESEVTILEMSIFIKIVEIRLVQRKVQLTRHCLNIILSITELNYDILIYYHYYSSESSDITTTFHVTKGNASTAAEKLSQQVCLIRLTTNATRSLSTLRLSSWVHSCSGLYDTLFITYILLQILYTQKLYQALKGNSQLVKDHSVAWHQVRSYRLILLPEAFFAFYVKVSFLYIIQHKIESVLRFFVHCQLIEFRMDCIASLHNH